MHKNTGSYWLRTSDQTQYPPLEGKKTVDVVIVGGGISGLTAALLLKQAGKTVAVVEEHSIASGESGHTTAHLTEIVDSGYRNLISRFGIDAARMVSDSSRIAINEIERLIHQSKVQCDFKRLPAFLYAEKITQIRTLQNEWKAMRDAGISAFWEKRVPLPFRTYRAIGVPNQATLHPRKYLLGLAKQIPGAGSYIFEHTQVKHIEEGERCKIRTFRGTLTARDLIVATNTPISSKVAMHTKVAAYRTYAVSCKINSAPRLEALYWDLDQPYHYIRSHDDVWIIGGEDHKTGARQDTENCFMRLEKYADSHFELREVLDHWSGQIIESVDGLPFIGLNPHSQHVYIATGFSGNGMTFGTISGILLSDLVQGKKNSWAELYDSGRFNVRASIKDYVLENKDFPLKLVEDRLLRTGIEVVDHLAKGGGQVIRAHHGAVAVSRDDAGELHAISGVCTHLGCHVQWNRAERTWDCPCHGSRYGVDGEVLNGPAVNNLKRLSLSILQKKKAA